MIKPTTRHDFFCRVQNSLPSVTLEKDPSVNLMSEKASLPSTFYQAFNKVFAEFAKVLDKVKSLWRWRETTMEPLPSARLRGTLQRQHEWAPMRSVCVEYVARHSATMIALPVSFPITIVWHSA